MNKFKGFYKVVVLLMLAALVLVACGESPTATPVATTAAIAATTAGAATTAKAATTTSAATTGAATTGAATTAKAGAATTGAKVGTALPNVEGATEITLDSTISNVFKTAFVGGLSEEAVTLPDLTIKVYASDNDTAKLTDNTDTAFTVANYKFSDVSNTGQTKMTFQSGGATGFYTKAGAADLIPIVADATQFSKSTSSLPPGVDAATYQKFTDQFKGKKSALIILSATGIVQTILKAKAASNTPATASAAVTTAVAGGSLGKELVGQTFNSSEIKSTVTGVEQLTEIKDANGGIVKPTKGVFLLVFADVENNSKFPDTATFELKDAAGVTYEGSGDGLLAATTSGNYADKKTSGGVPVGGKGKGFLVFDLPMDASGLKLDV